MKKEVTQGLNRETIMGMLKSKTIRVNAALVMIIVWAANAYGIPVTPEIATSIVTVLFGFVNVILRFLTKQPLPEKGIKIKNPKEVIEFVETIEENEEALEKLYIAIAKWKNEKKKEGKFTQAMNKGV